MKTLTLRIEFLYRRDSWRDIVAGVLRGLRANDLWLDFVHFGQMAAPLNPMPSDDSLVEGCMHWDRPHVLHTDPDGGPGAFGGDFCEIDPSGMPSLLLRVTGSRLQVRKQRILDGIVGLIKVLHDAGMRIVSAIVTVETDKPYPRVFPPRAKWNDGPVLLAFDLGVQSTNQAQQELQAEAARLLGIPGLAGVERIAHHSVTMLRFTPELGDDDAVLAARALSDRVAYIALDQERSALFSEQGDEYYALHDPVHHEPLTYLHRSVRGPDVGLKAVVVEDDAMWLQMAKWRREGLPDGTRLSELWAIVPLREHALATREKARSLGLEGVLYVGEMQRIWNPFPNGPWQPPLTDAELALRPRPPEVLSDPSMSWRPVSHEGAPSQRRDAFGFWSGAEMIVLGGECAVPAPGMYAYDPEADRWRPLSTAGAPLDRLNFAAAQAGDSIFVWGGQRREGRKSTFCNDGAIYSLREDAWRTVEANSALGARECASATFVDSEIIVWGGWSGRAYLNTGAIYDPSQGKWRKMPTTNAPVGRAGHSAVFTGSDLLILGGSAGGSPETFGSGRYNIRENKWHPLAFDNDGGALVAFWTGDRLITCHWDRGIQIFSLEAGLLVEVAKSADLGRVSASESPGPHGAVWTGESVIVYGGVFEGSVFVPEQNVLRRISLLDAPPHRSRHVAVWAGCEMIVWGGDQRGKYCNDGARLRIG